MNKRGSVNTAISLPTEILQSVDSITENRSKFISRVLNEWFEIESGKNPALIEIRINKLKDHRSRIDDEIEKLTKKLKYIQEQDDEKKVESEAEINNRKKESDKERVALFKKMEKLREIEEAYKIYLNLKDITDEMIDHLRDLNPESKRIIDHVKLKEFFEKVSELSEKEKD